MTLCAIIKPHAVGKKGTGKKFPPSITVNELRIRGFDVMDIRGTEKEGFSDKEIWEIVLFGRNDCLLLQTRVFLIEEMTKTRLARNC